MSDQASVSVKALTYRTAGGTPSFTYYTIALPLKPNHVVVKIKAAALNPIDTKLLHSTITNAYPGEKGLGRDFCGVIEHIGPEVTKFAVGDRVCGFYNHVGGYGTIASHVEVDSKADALIKAPTSLTDEEASAYPISFATAWQGIHRAQLTQESHAVVLGGATAAGIFAIQILKKYMGLKYVVASCSAASAEFVKSLGADETIDYKTQDTAHTLTSLNLKFNLIFDAVGGNAVQKIAKDILEPRESGSAFVTLVGDQEVGYDKVVGLTSVPKMLGRSLMGKFTGYNYFFEMTSPKGDWIQHSVDLIEAGKIKVVIDQVENWKSWKVLFDKMMAKKARGKLVLTIDEF